MTPSKNPDSLPALAIFSARYSAPEPGSPDNDEWSQWVAATFAHCGPANTWLSAISRLWEELTFGENGYVMLYNPAEVMEIMAMFPCISEAKLMVVGGDECSHWLMLDISRVDGALFVIDLEVPRLCRDSTDLLLLVAPVSNSVSEMIHDLGRDPGEFAERLHRLPSFGKSEQEIVEIERTLDVLLSAENRKRSRDALRERSGF